MTDVLLLHNENSGYEGFSRRKLEGLLRAHGYRPRYLELTAALRTRDVVDHGELVVVAGGDGSLRKVARRLLNLDRPIAPLPMGTANNIARNLRIDRDLEQIVAGWKHGKKRRFDVGLAEGPWGRLPFLECFGFGLFARAIAVIQDIDEASSREFKTGADKLHRDHCVFTALAYELSATKAVVAIDGRRDRGRYYLFEVLNTRRAGPGLRIAPEASTADGWLDVVAVRKGARDKLEDLMKGCAFGGKRASGEVERTRGRKFEIRLADGEVHIDGRVKRIREPTKIALEIDPGAITFFVPGTGDGVR